jgi:ketosteroid isomerase-like protein
MSLEKLIDQYHQAVDEFSRSNPEPVKALFSHRDDVTLADPFGPAVRGWKQASDALEFASSRFRDGEVSDFERIAEYESPDLATSLETERWRAIVGDREDVAPFDLRVTTTFRREDDTWNIVHRHADPVPVPHPDGPLRGS